MQTRVSETWDENPTERPRADMPVACLARRVAHGVPLILTPLGSISKDGSTSLRASHPHRRFIFLKR